MTDREKAIVMAHTGICMLTGNKFRIFHKYVEDIMGRPVWTHEMALDSTADEIREKSKDDFIALCEDESSSENQNKWIPVSERLPEDNEEVLCFLESEEMAVLSRQNNWGQYEWVDGGFATGSYDVIAWMPLPKPYKAESEVNN